MLRRAHQDERGITSIDYAGILAVVAVIFGAFFLLNLDEKVGPTVEKAVCQILGGESCGQEVAGTPEKCLVGQSTTSANANVFVAFVQIDKDSILIREDFSDGSSKFTIVDNTEAAGELFAGAKAKVGKLGADLSAEALAGVGLAGGRVFEFDNPKDADAFQETVQAAGGFDGILRDLASYNDEIPFIGVQEPARRRRRLGARPARHRRQRGPPEADRDLRRGQGVPQRLRRRRRGRRHRRRRDQGADRGRRASSRSPPRARTRATSSSPSSSTATPAAA